MRLVESAPSLWLILLFFSSSPLLFFSSLLFSVGTFQLSRFSSHPSFNERGQRSAMRSGSVVIFVAVGSLPLLPPQLWPLGQDGRRPAWARCPNKPNLKSAVAFDLSPARSGNELFIVLQKTFVIIWDDVWCILYFILELEWKSGQFVGLPTDYGKSWDECCLNTNLKFTNWTGSGTIWSKNQHDYECHQTLIQQTLYCWYQNMTPKCFLMFLLGSTGRTRLWSHFCRCRSAHVFWKISMSRTNDRNSSEI